LKPDIFSNSIIKVYWVTHSFISSPCGGSEIKKNPGWLNFTDKSMSWWQYWFVGNIAKILNH